MKKIVYSPDYREKIEVIREWLDLRFGKNIRAKHMAEIYTLDAENCSYELFEAIEDDYPALFLKELTFDGDTYTIGPLHYDGEDYSPICVPGYDSPQDHAGGGGTGHGGCRRPVYARPGQTRSDQRG